MRTTVTLDDDLIRDAKMYAGTDKPVEAMRIALESYVKTQAAKRLARMAGTMPTMTVPKRKQF